MNLEDVYLQRSNALTRLLAGCVIIAPLETLPMITRLKPEALTDIQARRYILAMYERLPELQQVDIDRQTEISTIIARDTDSMIDYLRWINLVEDVGQNSIEAVKELQALAITLTTLADLR